MWLSELHLPGKLNMSVRKTHKPKKHIKAIVLLISREWLIIKRAGTVKRIGPVID